MISFLRKSVRTKPYVIFSLLLLLKSFIAWHSVFEGGLSWRPFVTELPFIGAVFCLIEWFAPRRKLMAYMTVNLLLTGLFFAVIMYYKYYGVIVTYHALEPVNQVTAVKNSVFSLIHPYYLLIFTDLFILSIILMVNHTGKTWNQSRAGRMKKSPVTVIFAVSLALCLLQILPNRASMSEFKQAEEMGILNYEAYTLFSSEKEGLLSSTQITEERIRQLKGIQEPVHPRFAGEAAGRNVIVIQLESFQNFLIGLTLDGQEVTPVMNRLAREHFYFPNFYQQVGQGNTSDAEFVMNTSLYIPPEEAAVKAYAGKDLPSLPKLMKKQGYTAVTFHTNVVEFWNRGELYKALGYDRYYDQDFFGTEDTVFFGPSDEVLYDKTADVLKGMKQAGKPFYAHIVSMTAHHPFTIPKEKRRITLPERFQGSFVGDYLQSQNYADYALGRLIEKLKQSGLWDQSLIVLYGDHVGLPVYSLGRRDKSLMKELIGRKYSYTDHLNVPLILASEGVTYPAVMKQAGGQVDILPTLANLNGLSLARYIHFGQDLLNQTAHNLLPQRVLLPTGTVLNSRSLLIPGNGYEDAACYPLTGGGIQTTKDVSLKEYKDALKLLQLSDSYVRQLPDRNGKND